MSFGLNDEHIKILQDIFKKHLTTGEVIIYGSRVKNTQTKYSDIDLVLKQTKLNNHQLEDLIDETIESDLPYLCDIQLFENVKNANLLAHIERVGSVFYGGEK